MLNVRGARIGTFSANASDCGLITSRHLIADHLGWFKDSMHGGQMRTVEDLMKAKGEQVRKGRINASGDIEYYEVCSNMF